MQERWRAVCGWEGYYEISDHGRVRSVPRAVLRRNGTTYRVQGRILKAGSEKGSARLHVLLHGPDGKEKTAKIHQLVLEAFVGPCPDGQEACHRDDNASNNHLSNLRWDTKPANRKDCVRNGHDHNAKKTHCKWGHKFTPENTIVTKTGRNCRECQRRISREVMRRRRSAPMKQGVCGQCGRRRESFFKLCDRCREYQRDRSRLERERKRDAVS